MTLSELHAKGVDALAHFAGMEDRIFTRLSSAIGMLMKDFASKHDEHVSLVTEDFSDVRTRVSALEEQNASLRTTVEALSALVGPATPEDLTALATRLDAIRNASTSAVTSAPEKAPDPALESGAVLEPADEDPLGDTGGDTGWGKAA
jgi:hypothetical protein